MSILLTTLIPALLPALSHAISGLVGKWTGTAPAQPQNVAEACQLMGAETERVKAMAALDAPAANLSAWVADLRGSYRYITATLILLAFFASLVPAFAFSADAQAELFSLADVVISFLFGEHIFSNLRVRK